MYYTLFYSNLSSWNKHSDSGRVTPYPQYGRRKLGSRWGKPRLAHCAAADWLVTTGGPLSAGSHYLDGDADWLPTRPSLAGTSLQMEFPDCLLLF